MADSLLEPRRAAPGAIRRWLSESLSLLGRRPIAFALTSWGVAFLARAVPEVLQAPLAWLLYPSLFSLLFLLAYSADKSIPMGPLTLFATLRERRQEIARVTMVIVLLVGALFLIIALLASALAALWTLFATPGAEEARKALEVPLWQSLTAPLSELLWWFVLLLQALGTWCLLPLIISHQLKGSQAWSLSMEAGKKNDDIFFRLFVLSFVALMVSEQLGHVPSLLLLPWMGALTYVIYRDLFLRQAQNAEEKVEVPATAAAWNAV